MFVAVRLVKKSFEPHLVTNCMPLHGYVIFYFFVAKRSDVCYPPSDLYFADVQRKTKHGTVGPTYITLLEKPTDTIQDKMGDAERIAQRRIQMQERNKHKLKPVSQELKDVKGSFLQRIHQDAAVDICIRASMAGSANPMRFHLRIEELGDDEASAEELEQNALGAEQHWSFLETQMNRIEHEMHAIIAGVDFFKERDAIYHQQTDEMHKATTFWPILHVSILLITGFTQANHIVRFFQSRRII